MKNRHSSAFWALLAVFVGLGIWWIFHVPYRPDAVLGAIPSNATLVTVHENLARDCDVLIRQRAIRDSLLATGVREEDLNSLSSNRETRAWIHQLASRGTALAYVPAYGYPLKPAWVFASWIGGQSVTLRWQLRWLKSSDLRPVVLDHGRTVWMSRAKFSRPDQFLSLALVDGMVLGCVSSDPIGVQWLIETQEGRPARPSVLSSGQPTAARLLMPIGGQHWGWFNAIPGVDSSRFPQGPVAFRVTFTEQGSIRLTMATKQPLPQAGALSTNTGYTALANLLGTSLDLITVMPLAWVAPLFPLNTSPLWAESLEQWLDPRDAAPDALVFLAVLNRDHSGRIKAALGKSLSAFIGKGLRVPTVLIGVQVRETGDAAGRINRIVGTLNSRYGLALASQAVQIDGATVMAIGDARRSFYGKFEPREQVAYVVENGWLILSSNAEILGRLLKHSSSPSDANSSGQTAASKACALARIDLKGVGKTLKDTIAASQLALMVNDSGRSTDLRQTLNTVSDCIDLLQGFAEAIVSIRSTGNRTELDLVLGH